MMIQQGDVIIESVESFPDGCKKVRPSQKGYVLAEGEVTGHAHAITEIEGVECEEKDGMFFIRIKTDKELTHEEHKTVTIPPGTYRVRKVREYNHFAEESKNVAD